MHKKVLHRLGIYPHDGKKVIFEREGMNEVIKLRDVIEAVSGLGVPPNRIEQRLKAGEKVVFRPHRERE